MLGMAYASYGRDLVRGNIAAERDDLFVMLVSGYVPDKVRHSSRADITGEVAGDGYRVGGQKLFEVRVAPGNDGKESVLFAKNPVWPDSDLSASGAVIYKARGGKPEFDNLLGYVDFGKTVISSGGAFEVKWSQAGILTLI